MAQKTQQIIKLKHEESSSKYSGKCIEILINGYIRNHEKEYKLLIPPEIAQIIYKSYPSLLFKFGDFNKDFFIINEEKTILKGIDGDIGRVVGSDCNGFMVYADLGQDILNDIGINTGVYFWSVKCLLEVARCFASIGVTTEKNDKLINHWDHDGMKLDDHWFENFKEGGRNSFYQGCTEWQKDQIITVRLDCDNWTVKYYKDKENTNFKEDKIEANKSYYFAMMVCNLESLTHYQIVQVPDHFY